MVPLRRNASYACSRLIYRTCPRVWASVGPFQAAPRGKPVRRPASLIRHASRFVSFVRADSPITLYRFLQDQPLACCVVNPAIDANQDVAAS